MNDDELLKLINELSHKFGTETKMKQKMCLIMSELLARTMELDRRYPIRRSVGRPKKLVKEE